MKATPLAIPDVVLLEPEVHTDNRGFFFESFNLAQFQDAIGRRANFVQDNHSKSVRNVVRGIHFQIRHPQGKLIRVVSGSVFDVAVDLRRSSPTFGQWVGEIISADCRKQLWIPEGFGHGFAVLSETAELLYKTTDYYSPEFERAIAWNDTEIGIKWPLNLPPILSKKDTEALPFARSEVYGLRMF